MNIAHFVDKETFAVPMKDTLETINIIRRLLTQLFDYRLELTERYATPIFACLLSGAIHKDSAFCARKSLGPAVFR